ncbi:MAG TPA: hypothetical protein DEQ68_07225 [Ruminococcaceae bacterium]|nr:hypothetical protein [Oscillospiraceae bacterium]
MKFNLKKCVSGALLAAVLLSGCSSEESVPSEISVSSVTEIEENAPFPAISCGVRLEKAVEKAVSLSPAVTEIICEAGFQKSLVGVSDYCDYPENLGLPKLGSTENPDLDAIIKLKPDAVFTLSLMSEREIYKLNQAGIKVLTPKAPCNLEEYAGLYKEISAAFYGNEQTDSLKGGTKSLDMGKGARARLENASKEVKTESFVYVTEKFTLAGADTFESAVLSLSGENLCKSEGYVPANGEQPAYIVASNKLSYEELAADSAFAAMIYNGAKVIFVNSERFERPSARTAEIFTAFLE